MSIYKVLLLEMYSTDSNLCLILPPSLFYGNVTAG